MDENEKRVGLKKKVGRNVRDSPNHFYEVMRDGNELVLATPEFVTVLSSFTIFLLSRCETDALYIKDDSFVLFPSLQ